MSDIQFINDELAKAILRVCNEKDKKKRKKHETINRINKTSSRKSIRKTR